MTRHAQWTVRLGFAVLVVTATVLGLLISEIALRLLRPGENLLTTATLGIYAPDPELGWVNKRDFTGSRDWAGREVLIRTDAEGRRVPTGHVPTSRAAQIAFAGDSYVFGNEVNAEETFVYLFGEASQTRTINLGVGGYSLSQECLAFGSSRDTCQDRT